MSSAASPPPETRIPTFLQHTGIPPSLLHWRPKLPSRNWLIFLSSTSTLVGLYAYDRWKCKQIRNEYIAKVKHLADNPLPTSQFPRRITVYGAKWPDDEDTDVSLKYFRKYIKPILTSAAVDYEMVNGRRQGDLAEKICEDIKSRRRVDLGIDPEPFVIPMAIPGQTLRERRQRELDGAIVIMGRQTLKEFMHGLKRGWTEPPFKVDKEELLARELEPDGVFDEPDTEGSRTDSLQSSPRPSNPFNMPSPFQDPSLLGMPKPASHTQIEHFQDKAELINPPFTIPDYPPLLLMPFTDLIGFKQIPRMLFGFFNRRRDVKLGAEAAYKIITGTPRPIRGPVTTFDEETEKIETSPLSDLSFGLDAENLYKSKPPSVEIEKARKSYYKHLPEKLAVARQLARGEREATKEERNYPPPTEVELRAERMKKEKRWRGDLAGWDIIKPTAPVAWDSRFATAFVIYPFLEDEMSQENTTF